MRHRKFAPSGTSTTRRRSLPHRRQRCGGTLVRLDDARYSLFTRGTVNFYRTYPGMYVPTPVGLRPSSVESSMEHLAAEVLGLTKLNWNQSQLDGRLPITLRAAQQVSRILKHMPNGGMGDARYAQYI